MTFTFKLARRMARSRAPLAAATLLALAACASDSSFGPEQPTVLDPAAPTATAFAGGIPIGFFAHPLTMFNDRYNGGHQNVTESNMLRELAEIKSRGGKVVLALTGAPRYYLDGSGRFSFTKWKERNDRFRGINFSSYVNDGTIIGHLLIDEPNDAANWAGEPVSPAMLEEMGRYSKQLWPDMPTIIRVEPGYLLQNHRYVDAAWAQYLYRRGDVNAYIKRNVEEAQERGLALVVGMNVLKGGNPTGTRMTSSEVQSWGSALLSSTYPCAFISWEYNEDFLATSGMGSAMDELRRRAENRSTRTCRRTSGSTTPPPAPEPEPEPEPEPQPEPPTTGEGLMFGPYGVPVATLGRYSSSVRVATPSNVLTTLRAARSAGVKVMLRLTDVDLRNANGTFSLSKWKAAVDRFAGVNLSSYVSDGTFAGHLLVHGADVPSRWGGQRISHATLDEMARYSRARWAAVPAVVDADATGLATTTWRYLDAASVVYTAAAGDAAIWVDRQADAAARARLGLVVGMNVINGGTRTSGIAGTQQGRYAMSATQLRSWGAKLMAEARTCGFFLHRYEERYFGRTDVKSAIAELARTAEGRTASSCRKR